MRKELIKAEVELGLLGWQQADFDEATQKQVDAIHHVEREQANLANRSAEMNRALTSLMEERERNRADSTQRGALIEAELATARAPLAEAERLLRVLRDREPEVSRGIDELEKEEEEISALHERLLLVQPQPPDVQKELLDLRNATLANANKKADLKVQLARALSDIEERERERAEARAAIEKIESKLHEHDAEARKSLEQSEALERDLEREKAGINREIEQLDRAKSDPYREIGRVLADSGIAPMNQPAALEKVQDLRASILGIENSIAGLARESATQNQSDLVVSFALLAIIALALWIVLEAIF